ncbi:MAG: tRNA lysidine(34) synthetase TilS [Clostridia bacterium]|nr:tRNA lysidine(34) synthetase TilS [Clostridia bacterium]
MFDKNLFNKQESVAVALSGGKDSVFLLHLLYTHANELGITLKAVNVEHGIRGENSLRDTEFVKKLCEKFDIELLCFSVNTLAHSKENGYSEEQSARILRYECFEKAINSGFCNKIATAHHLSDNAETVLLNLFRGSALSGVSGIPKTALNGKIIRPILNTSKQTINEYIEKNNLPFVTDESNEISEYSRNFIRNCVIPIIEQRFEGATCAINRFSSIAYEENKLLDNLSQKLIEGNSVIIPKKEEFALFKRACLSVIKSMGFEKDFTKTHLDNIIDLTQKQTGRKINLKFGLTAHKKSNRILFIKNEQIDENIYQIIFDKPIETSHYIIKLETVKEVTKKQLTAKDALYIDKDKLPQSAVIRTKKTGDEIFTFGKKQITVKKFFTDKKIDSTVNKHLPLIAVDKDILAVLTVDISQKLAVDENTTKIIKLTAEKKGEHHV